MTSQNILKSIKTKGGVNFFPGTYVPSNKPTIDLTYMQTFKLEDTIDSMDALGDIVVISSVKSKTVYILERSNFSLNLISTITPSSANIQNSVEFGKTVKITNYGIFVTDPSYSGTGAVFLFYNTQIGQQTWLANPVQIRPLNYDNCVNYGESISVADNLLLVGDPSYKNQNTTGSVFYFSINYNTKGIIPITNIINPDTNTKTFGSEVILSSDTLSYISVPDSSGIIDGQTETNLGTIYICSIEGDIIKNILPPEKTTNFGSSISKSNNLFLCSDNTQTENYLYVYSIAGYTWTLISKFNITTLDINSYSSGNEGSSLYIYNSLLLWNNNPSEYCYIAEYTESKEIVKSINYEVDKENYNYGISFATSSDKILILGTDGTNSIVDVYQIS